jgi:hypothetical protein
MDEGSEYHTASEFMPDFDSDNEPPVDKENEKKLFHKTQRHRIYKRILRVPKKSLELPARFDRVDVRWLEVETEVLSAGILADQPIQHWQLGMTDIPKSVEIAITSMKRGEVTVFENETVMVDKETKERKLVGKSYFVIELVDFVTIIDVFNDRTVFKIQLEKGVGIDRLTTCARVRIELRLLTPKGEILFEKNDDGKTRPLQEYVDQLFQEPLIKDLAAFKSQTMDILMTMKENEVSFVEFPDPLATPLPPQAIASGGQESQEPQPLERKSTGHCLVKVRDLSVKTIADRLYLSVNVIESAKIDDVFSDGTVLRKTLKPGVSTASPEQLSLVFFDYTVVLSGQVIVSSDLTSLRKEPGRGAERRPRRQFLPDQSDQPCLSFGVRNQ